MSANHQASAFAGALTPGQALPLRGLCSRIAKLAPVASALFHPRRLRDALDSLWRKSRGPEMPPEDDRPGDGIWDDAELWIMIMMP
ncbi:MAG: hypothetical protein J2P48_05540 [Alphaproteobacteria bacterium]|nr:hypothetical protein [Alphaproteobacteria bacterium]